jgi:hypothetical protein
VSASLSVFEALVNAAIYRVAETLLAALGNLLNMWFHLSFMPSCILRPKLYCVLVSCLQACVWRRGRSIVPSLDCIRVSTFICVLSTFCQVRLTTHWHSCWYRVIKNSGIPRNFFGVWGWGSPNSVEDRGQREWGSVGGSPLIRGSTQFAKEWNPYSD